MLSVLQKNTRQATVRLMLGDAQVFEISKTFEQESKKLFSMG